MNNFWYRTKVDYAIY